MKAKWTVLSAIYELDLHFCSKISICKSRKKHMIKKNNSSFWKSLSKTNWAQYFNENTSSSDVFLSECFEKFFNRRRRCMSSSKSRKRKNNRQQVNTRSQKTGSQQAGIGLCPNLKNWVFIKTVQKIEGWCTDQIKYRILDGRETVSEVISRY